MNAWPLFLLCALVACCIYFILNSLRTKYKKCNGHRLPPGPWGLPILGHLHLLGDLPHRNLHKLANKFGPIMYLRLGMVQTIVVSSPEAAELFLKNHDLNFATRPKVQASEYISYGQRNIAFGQYGSRWRNTRKLCIVQLLSSSKVETMRPMREGYLRGFVEWLRDAAETHTVVDVSAKVGSLIQDMTLGMTIGNETNIDRSEFKSSIKEVMTLLGLFNLADYVPFVGALDLQGLLRRFKKVSRDVDGFLESIIDEHVRDPKNQKKHQKDFIDILVSLMDSSDVQVEQLDRPTIKAIILDMIAAAMDTSTNAIEWALSDLLKHPRVIRKVQTELQNVVGMDRMVEESDLVKLDYLDYAVKESMRLHPVAPLLIPHQAREDVTINGHYIPKNSRVIVNVWAIGRDLNAWSSNAEEFFPERFMDTNTDFKGNDMRFIPFGSGRRMCPGSNLGLTNVRLVVAQLVHCFNWKLPNGMSNEDLDMREKFGLTMPRQNHLLAVPTFRLHINEL